MPARRAGPSGAPAAPVEAPLEFGPTALQRAGDVGAQLEGQTAVVGAGRVEAVLDDQSAPDGPAGRSGGGRPVGAGGGSRGGRPAIRPPGHCPVRLCAPARPGRGGSTSEGRRPRTGRPRQPPGCCGPASIGTRFARSARPRSSTCPGRRARRPRPPGTRSRGRRRGRGRRSTGTRAGRGRPGTTARLAGRLVTENCHAGVREQRRPARRPDPGGERSGGETDPEPGPRVACWHGRPPGAGPNSAAPVESKAQRS